MSEEESEEEFNPLFIVGIVLSLFASASTNLGANLQRLALRKEDQKELNQRRPMYKIPLWVGGFALFLGSQAGDALALGFAPQSVVQPVGSVSLLANLYFGWCLNGEPIGKTTPIALAIIITGVALIVTFGPKETVDWDDTQVAARWAQTDMIICAIQVSNS